MKDSNAESCQTCFRPTAVDGAQPQTQWISVCRCDRPYSPNAAQVTIDVCGNCKLRVPIGVGGRAVDCAGLCSCAQPNPKKVPTYIKQNEGDAVALDLAAVGMSPETFPVEKYTPIGILGQGARATAILARDRQRGTKVAVKCFKRIAPTLKSTFESEVRKNKELTYTTIAKVIDFGFQGGKTPYLVTEYKDGFNLEQYLAMHGTPSDDVAVKILISVCEAVIYAQKQGLLHRDIRPGNIIFLDDMNSEPSISILDFALPKIKASEQLTEPVDAVYMSADEARGLEYTEKSEEYSIGCIGYALLTGRPPFRDGTALDIKNMHGLKLPPKISDLKFDNKRPKDLEEIIYRCLEKDPSYRFDTIPKLLERLEVFPRRVQMQIAAVLAARRRKKILLFGALILIVLLVCVVVSFILGHH